MSLRSDSEALNGHAAVNVYIIYTNYFVYIMSDFTVNFCDTYKNNYRKKRKQIHSDGGKRIFLLIFVVNSIISCGSRVTRVRISRSVYSLKQI